MSTYNVHVYAIVRVKVVGIEADDMRAAVNMAIDGTNFYSLLNSDIEQEALAGTVEHVEFAEEFSHFLVDVEGDEDFEESEWFVQRDDGTLVKGAYQNSERDPHDGRSE